MLRVWPDVLTSADVREVTLLGLLDFSAAFDCVDHDILLRGLKVAFGLTNTVLEWIRSFLTDRTQHVSYCGRLSPIQHVLFGVPQWSVLGPLLYVLYTAELELIVARHGLRLHMYADDCQVYLDTSVEDVPRCMCRGHQRLAECVQTSAERGEDTAVVARLESACGQGRLPRRPGARHSRRHLGQRSRPRCHH